MQILRKHADQYIAYEKITSTVKDKVGIIFLGGYRSDMQGWKGTNLSIFAKENNLNFLRFDYSGHGLSSGKFGEGTIGKWIDDAIFMLDNVTEGKQILIGSSMGVWLMLYVALKRPERIAGLFGLAPGVDATKKIWDKMSIDEKEKLKQNGFIDFSSTFESFSHITSDLIEEGNNHLFLDNEINIEVPTYLFHGMKDEIVPFEQSIKLASKLKTKDVTIRLIKDLSHSMNNESFLNTLKSELIIFYNHVKNSI